MLPSSFDMALVVILAVAIALLVARTLVAHSRKEESFFEVCLLVLIGAYLLMVWLKILPYPDVPGVEGMALLPIRRIWAWLQDPIRVGYGVLGMRFELKRLELELALYDRITLPFYERWVACPAVTEQVIAQMSDVWATGMEIHHDLRHEEEFLSYLIRPERVKMAFSGSDSDGDYY